MGTSTDWEESIRAYRARKDEYFRESPHSPLPADEQESFDGLSYFPADRDYRFEVDIHEHETPETITVATTTEGEREYIVWGEFTVSLHDDSFTVQVYRADPDEDALWVPFRDETSGDETYGAGRYLDLGPDDRTDDGTWVVDFNLAYNPFCAYSPRYECPLVPMENWLDVPIYAGEKTYQETAGPDAAD
ncbi:MAG: DUF1684 domain-containing protein [Halobacteriota archaeon]